MPEIQDPVDFSRAYWTPPLTPALAYETERDQIENILWLDAMVSLTDHDNIEAGVFLRTMPDTAHAPISVEWSVPFAGTVFHLGIHNLPSRLAQIIMDDLAAYTRKASDRRLGELLAMLNEFPGVLVVFNHPLWTQSCVGVQRGRDDLDRFLNCAVQFLHAFEINAARSAKENNRVKELAASMGTPACLRRRPAWMRGQRRAESDRRRDLLRVCERDTPGTAQSRAADAAVYRASQYPHDADAA